MKTLGILTIVTLLLTACSTTTPLAVASKASVSGAFTVTLTGAPSATSVGNTCRLDAPIQMNFTGGLIGPAQGEISILAPAPCAEVVINPPGTFRDTFRAEVVLDGDVAGQTGTVQISYQGNTKPGGAVRGILRIHGGTGELADVRGVLKVEAQAGVGGTYTGHLTGLP